MQAELGPSDYAVLVLAALLSLVWGMMVSL
jgi:hypothetical protein